MKHTHQAFKLLSLSLFLLTPGYTAHAFDEGGRIGGGGGVVECMKPSMINRYESNVEFVDLYAASHSFSGYVKVIRSSDSLAIQIRDAIAKAPPFLQNEMERVYLKLKIQVHPFDFGFGKPYDLGERPFVLADGCDLHWIAFLDDLTYTLKIFPQYFNRMGPTDQAALFVHEIIYYLMRQYGNETDSASTREIVPLFFTEGDQRGRISDLTLKIFALKTHPAALKTRLLQKANTRSGLLLSK